MSRDFVKNKNMIYIRKIKSIIICILLILGLLKNSIYN